MFLYAKTFHIIFVVTWFCGLFYIIRLAVYHIEASEKDDAEKKILRRQFTIMGKRLWYGIAWPSCVFAIFFGMILLMYHLPLENWLIAKLIVVFLLLLYHIVCGIMMNKIWKNIRPYSSSFLRIWNEVATIFLVTIVSLAVLENIQKAFFMFFGIVILLGVVFALIRIKRTKNRI